MLHRYSVWGSWDLDVSLSSLEVAQGILQGQHGILLRGRRQPAQNQTTHKPLKEHSINCIKDITI